MEFRTMYITDEMDSCHFKEMIKPLTETLLLNIKVRNYLQQEASPRQRSILWMSEIDPDNL
jgi:hypothetical protein